MKIAFAFTPDRLVDIQSFLNNYIEDVEINFTSTEEELIDFEPEIVVTNQYDWSLRYCSDFLNVKWVHLMSSGVDKACNILKNRENNLILTNLRGIHGESISNFVLNWILCDSNNILLYIENQKLKEWSRYRNKSLINKKALIYGLGHIGNAIAEKLIFMGVTCLCVNTSENDLILSDLKRIIPNSKVKEYIKDVDYIVISAPLTEINKSYIDDSFFSVLENRPILINISRAEIIEKSALVNSLRNNKIKFAVLDVHYTEPLDKRSDLWREDGVYITPHISGYFDNGMQFGLDLFKHLLNQYKYGDIRLSNIVSMSRGY
jgi:D-2-hydroxyacid dehydrogenase (NADP+)